MAFNKDGLMKIGGDNGQSPLARSLWLYSTTDAIATVNSAGYFPTGYGLRGDDVMIVTDITNHLGNIVMVLADLDVTDGLAITATDTD